MRSIPVAALTFLVTLVSACSQAPAGAPPQPAATPTVSKAAAPAFPLNLTDGAGRQVTLAKQPQRLVSLSASNTEILFALDLGERVVGVDQYSDFPPSVKDKPRVGSYTKPDLEKILALEPDLILGTGIHVKTVVPELEKRGLTVMVVDPKGVKDVLEGIRMVGQATGHQRQADALAEGLRARIEAVEAKLQGTEPVRVFYELSPSLHTAGPGSYVDDLIRLVRGTNIAAGAGKEWPQLNQESLLLADPEVVLLADHEAGETPERVLARPGWQQITAVKTKRVYAVDPNLTNRPGPRVIDGLELIASKLHPDRLR